MKPTEIAINVFVALLVLVWEWWAPRSTRIKANSTIEAIANGLLATILARMPGVRGILAALGSREPEKQPLALPEVHT